MYKENRKIFCLRSEQPHVTVTQGTWRMTKYEGAWFIRVSCDKELQNCSIQASSSQAQYSKNILGVLETQSHVNQESAL